MPRLLVDEQAFVSELRDESIVALIHPRAAENQGPSAVPLHEQPRQRLLARQPQPPSHPRRRPLQARGHVAFDRQNNTLLSNLFVRMLHHMNIEAEKFGTSNGVISEV